MRRLLLLPLVTLAGCAVMPFQPQPAANSVSQPEASAKPAVVAQPTVKPTIVTAPPEIEKPVTSAPKAPARAEVVQPVVGAPQPVAPAEAKPVAQPTPHADEPALSADAMLAQSVEQMRLAADGKDAPIAPRKAIVAALIARGGASDLVEAEKRLRALDSAAGISAQWLRLQRAALADAGGEMKDLEGATREAWLACLRELPLETRGIHATDGEKKDGAFNKRESISYRPDEYVSVALEARYFGVKDSDGRFDYAFKVSARLLKEDGTAVADFAPPAHVYKGTLDYPAHRFAWFEFVLQQRLPRDLAAGNYIVELTLSDETCKQALGTARLTLDIRVR